MHDAVHSPRLLTQKRRRSEIMMRSTVDAGEEGREVCDALVSGMYRLE